MRAAGSLSIRCASIEGDGPSILKVAAPGESSTARPERRLILASHPAAAELSTAGMLITHAAAAPVGWHGWWVAGPEQPGAIQPGDVVAIQRERRTLHILWRRGANANSLFATGRCNSLCLMCSQPPKQDDPDRVREMLEVIPLIDPDEAQLGISGGEPLLVNELPVVVAACRDRLPRTRLHILTNGRRFADEELVQRFARLAHPDLTWAVPLYGDLPELHDYVVQAEGAFAETMRGLAHLAMWRQRVELRVVLHRPTVARLRQLAGFIVRHLPFVEHVALMGLEPIGFARANRESLIVPMGELAEPLADAAWHLANRGLPVSIYNLPLCVLPGDLHRFTQRSISDWKNKYAPACEGCAARADCGGMFTWDDGSWFGEPIKPFTSLSYHSGALQ